MNQSELRDKVANRLAEIAAPKYSSLGISDQTEIYYDLKISGVDFYEFLAWVAREFDVKFNIEIGEYTPPEGWDLFFLRKRRAKQRPYKSFKVSDVIAAIQARHWPLKDAH